MIYITAENNILMLRSIPLCLALAVGIFCCSTTNFPCFDAFFSFSCRQDCVRLLSNCGNFSRGPYGAQEEARKRCVLLLGGDGGDCVSIYELSGES